MLTQINIGPATLPSYQFLALIGIWTAMWFAAKNAAKFNIDGDHLYNIGLYGFISALLGGRFWYVITHWDAYSTEPLQALAITANAIAVPEAILFAIIATIIYCKRNKLSLGKVADAAAPGIALGLVIGGVGAFLGSQMLGTETSLPWGVSLFDAVRHPAHLYVTLAVLVIFAVTLKTQTDNRPAGFSFLQFTALYAAARLLLDPFFALPDTIGAGLRVVQVTSLAALVLIIAVMARLDAGNIQSPRSKVQGLKSKV